MKRFFLVLLLPLALLACNSETENLRSEVMAIHDEVMPKMDDIMKEKSRLSALMSETEDSLKIIRIRTAMSELEAADEGMMQWMRQFKPEEFENDEDALIQYYQEEMVRIKEVKTNMLNALENSKSVVN